MCFSGAYKARQIHVFWSSFAICALCIYTGSFMWQLVVSATRFVATSWMYVLSVCIYVFLSVLYTFACARPTRWATCMYLCIYVSMYLCMYVSMYLCIYVSMYLCMRQIEPSCKCLYDVEADMSVCRRYTLDLIRRSLFAAEHTNQQVFCSRTYKWTFLLQQSIQINISFAS